MPIIKSGLFEFKVLTNTALGESWEEQGHTIEGDPILRRRELYPYAAPEGV